MTARDDRPEDFDSFTVNGVAYTDYAEANDACTRLISENAPTINFIGRHKTKGLLTLFLKVALHPGATDWT